jgi:hypothetical protein
MSLATPKMREFAKRLIAYEIKSNRSAETKTAAVFLVSEKLRLHLTALMGNVGFRALLSRALALANAEVPWLHAVRVKADGSFGGLHGPGAQVGPEQLAEGSVVLLAQLLGLLVTFIGGSLTLGLVREMWPKIPLNDLDFGNGDKNENPK